MGSDDATDLQIYITLVTGVPRISRDIPISLATISSVAVAHLLHSHPMPTPSTDSDNSRGDPVLICPGDWWKTNRGCAFARG